MIDVFECVVECGYCLWGGGFFPYISELSFYAACFEIKVCVCCKWFFEEVRSGRFEIVVSQTVLDELKAAPEQIKVFVSKLMGFVEVVELDAEIEALRDAYMDAGIIGKSSLDDAEHIATASVAGVELVVSWNFKHIVHFDKIRGYNAINLLKGYSGIDIRSPTEVVSYEDE